MPGTNSGFPFTFLCNHNKAGRRAQVCKDMPWLGATHRHLPYTGAHIISHAGFGSFSRLYSAPLVKGGFPWHSNQPFQVSCGVAEGQSYLKGFLYLGLFCLMAPGQADLSGNCLVGYSGPRTKCHLLVKF